MHLLIIGGSGRTGKLVIEEALQRGMLFNLLEALNAADSGAP